MGRIANFEVDVADVASEDVAAWHELVLRVLQGEAAGPDVSVGILLTDDTRMAQYNRDFRGIDEPTDVLSFEAGDDDFPPAPGEPEELGDIVISLETARRQAGEHGWSLQEEVNHLLTHATLHLCGLDHERSAAAERSMREREEHYLGPLDIVHGEQP